MVAAAAAQESPQQKRTSEPPLETWLSALPEDEKQEFLTKLVRREPNVDLQFISRLKELAGKPQSVIEFTPGYRTLSELTAIANTDRTKRKQKEKEVARKKRIKELDALAPHEEETWKQVVKLLEAKQAKPYDEATALLKNLRDLAEHQGRLPEFAQRFERFKTTYQNRPALLTRFKTIKV